MERSIYHNGLASHTVKPEKLKSEKEHSAQTNLDSNDLVVAALFACQANLVFSE